GAETEENVYKGRRWTAGGGPYRLVVSADSGELHADESVDMVHSLQEKKSRVKSDSEEEENKYDKVTQRVIVKHGRKRQRLILEDGGERKRRRDPVNPSTTGLPQTMSYNLYNHFRPLEQDVPQDHLLPFLDFGRKLSTGSTPSGVNSIESSSTPRGMASSSTELFPAEEVYHDDMDVTVMKKTVEKNKVPQGPIQLRHSSSFFKLSEGGKNATQESHNVNNTNLNSNKTDMKKDVHYDLQSNESGVKTQLVLSPNYGLRLNRYDSIKNDTNQTETQHLLINVQPLKEKQSIEAPLQEVISDGTVKPTFDKPAKIISILKPSPTARILSTAVVTSVSVKESPRFPRIKLNSSDEYENGSDVKINSSDIPSVDRSLKFESLLNSTRRKPYTTLRPKTTSYKPVTFRSIYRRNTTFPVVHVVSTPPTYIEVPKIITQATRTKKEPPMRNSEVVGVNEGELAIENSTSTTTPISVETTVKSSTSFQSSSKSSVSSSKTSMAANNISTAIPFSTTGFTTTTTTTKPTTTLPTTSTTTTTSTTPPSSTTSTPSTTPTLSTTPTPSTTTPPITSTTTPSSVTINNFTSTPFTSTIPTNTPTTYNATTSAPTTANTTYITERPSSTPNYTTEEIVFKSLDDILSRTTERSEDAKIKTTTKEPSSFNLSKIDNLWVVHQRNHTIKPSTINVSFQDSTLSLVTYILAGLGVIPLILGGFLIVRQIMLKSKKKVLDESEYSSEYNRSPLPTKLPRVPTHLNWEETKPAIVPVPITKWEFPRDKLRLQTVLGQGNFGQVWKAEADDISGHEGLTRLVAVKTVKEGATQKEKEDLLRELGIMQELGAHPNVVTLLGCCTDKEPYLLIMEYVMYGKLLAFLREHRTRAHYFNFSDLSSALTSRDLTVFAYCVARGMEYLVTKGIIHRDLAARNILVDHNKLCKIADFGMSRNVRDTGQIYEQRPNRGAMPIRWMAPESLHFSLFTHKSDVWSFGILLWEIITLGSTPYNTMGAREVMHHVREGYRLEKPKHCRSEFFRVLTKCWHNDPEKRPSFSELKSDIGNLLGDKDTEGGFVDLEAMAEEISNQGN
ncbi:macrophage colony-stimulating factor 1 receptor 2-like, partial [Cimex lectularius]|uniref:receptor protein-tyrosine kinase n=1 Tax=Cimex lectularius TaxID=79782 RepID=A0A8I6SQM5_CIMLE